MKEKMHCQFDGSFFKIIHEKCMGISVVSIILNMTFIVTLKNEFLFSI